MEEERTTEEEMNRKATLADVEAFGKKIGVFKLDAPTINSQLP